MKKIIFIICILLLVAMAGVYVAITNGYIRMNYPSFEKYPVHGLDISHHQEYINWDKVDKQYAQFVFIKATEGSTHKDTRFMDNWLATKGLEIPVAAYHFFTFCTDGKEQAINFIRTVPKDQTSLPPVIDLEFGGNCKPENRKEDLLQEIKDYLETVEKHYNKRAIIYSTQDFYNQYLVNEFLENPVWIRDILGEPKLEENREWLFWQYANRGKLKGINGFVDMNAFNGSLADLQNLQNSYINKAKSEEKEGLRIKF